METSDVCPCTNNRESPLLKETLGLVPTPGIEHMEATRDGALVQRCTEGLGSINHQRTWGGDLLKASQASREKTKLMPPGTS